MAITSEVPPQHGATAARSPMLGVAVVEGLVDAIVSGTYRPGEALPAEAALCEQFGVSRTVLRESVKRVEEKGLLSIARGRGTIVQPSSSWRVLDQVVLTALIRHDDDSGMLDELTVVRAQLESIMAEGAARLRDEEGITRLTELVQRMGESIEDPLTFRATDVEFHQTIMTLSQQRLAESIARILIERALGSDRYHGVDVPGHVEQTLAEHQAVLHAIVEQDPGRAQQAMNTHIRESWLRRRPPK